MVAPTVPNLVRRQREYSKPLSLESMGLPRCGAGSASRAVHEVAEVDGNESQNGGHGQDEHSRRVPPGAKVAHFSAVEGRDVRWPAS
jgi:hypothetical protein